MTDPVLIQERRRKFIAKLDEQQERIINDAVKDLKISIKIESVTENTKKLLDSYGYVYSGDNTYNFVDPATTPLNLFGQPLKHREQNEKICYNIFCLICFLFLLNMANRVINWMF